MKIEIEAGDWICFQQLGLPCYGKVEYIRTHTILKRNEYVTTAGTCTHDDVLEVRKKVMA